VHSRSEVARIAITRFVLTGMMWLARLVILLTNDMAWVMSVIIRMRTAVMSYMIVAGSSFFGSNVMISSMSMMPATSENRMQQNRCHCQDADRTLKHLG